MDITDKYLEMARDHVQRATQQASTSQEAFFLDQARAIVAGGLYDPEADHARLRDFDVAAEVQRARENLGPH